MFQKLRIALTTAAMLAVTVFATAGPATSASTGETCMDPDITVTPTVTTSGGLLSIYVIDWVVTGRTDATCPAFLTNYRYKVAVSYSGQTVSTYHSGLAGEYGLRGRTGTTISFPTLRTNFQGYNKPYTVTLTAGSKSMLSSVWCRSNETTTDYSFTLFNPSWFSQTVSTANADGVPRGRINACP